MNAFFSRQLVLIGLAVAVLAGCKPNSPAATDKAMPSMPPAQPRPGNLGPSVKWAPESGRYQQVRRAAWAEGVDFESKVDLRTEQTSRHGFYHVKLLHRAVADQDGFEQWVVALTDATGKPVSGADVHVQGGMPAHGHGLFSQPQIQAGDQPGEYLVKGLALTMAGWWEMNFYIAKNKVDDSASLNVLVKL